MLGIIGLVVHELEVVGPAPGVVTNVGSTLAKDGELSETSGGSMELANVLLEIGLGSVIGIGEMDIGEDDPAAVEVGELGKEVALLTRLAWLSSDKDDSTLKTELVAVKAPVVMLGTVAANDIVGVLVRPCAPLSTEVTPLVLIAGVAEDSSVEGAGVNPGVFW